MAFAHQPPALQSRSRAAQLGRGAIIEVMAPILAPLKVLDLQQ
jgi:hypothetical protein